MKAKWHNWLNPIFYLEIIIINEIIKRKGD